MVLFVVTIKWDKWSWLIKAEFIPLYKGMGVGVLSILKKKKKKKSRVRFPLKKRGSYERVTYGHFHSNLYHQVHDIIFQLFWFFSSWIQ